MKAILYVGRWMFASLFLLSAFTHMQPETQALGAAHGIPPWLTVAAGVMACVGGICVATGRRAREGACLLVGFLVPVTLKMHAFWDVADPQQATLQFFEFMKNLSLTGASLMIVYLGSTAWSGAEPSPLVQPRRRTHRVTQAELLHRR
jgi:putative oxidoreductase